MLWNVACMSCMYWCNILLFSYPCKSIHQLNCKFLWVCVCVLFICISTSYRDIFETSLHECVLEKIARKCNSVSTCFKLSERNVFLWY